MRKTWDGHLLFEIKKGPNAESTTVKFGATKNYHRMLIQMPWIWTYVKELHRGRSGAVLQTVWSTRLSGKYV